MPNMVKKEPPTGGKFNSSYTHRDSCAFWRFQFNFSIINQFIINFWPMMLPTLSVSLRCIQFCCQFCSVIPTLPLMGTDLLSPKLHCPILRGRGERSALFLKPRLNRT